MIKLYRLYYQYLEYLILPIRIEQIKSTYEFREGFVFDGWFRDIKTWSEQYREHEDLASVRKMKNQFMNLVTTADSFTDLLANFSKQREELSRQLDPFQDEALYHSPKTGLTHEELQNIVMEFKGLWQNCLDSLPVVKGGRPSDTHNKRCVNLLLMMFNDGSELEPSCYWYEFKCQYYGCFFDFLTDMLPVLQAKGITFSIEDESLGRYAAELIPQRRNDKEYMHKFYQIDESLLKE